MKEHLRVFLGTALPLLLSGGCAPLSALSTLTHGPNGKEAFVIHCGGLARNWGVCYAEAGKLCGTRGYDIVDQNGEHAATGMIAPSIGVGAPVISRSMLVQCKD